MNCDRSGTVCVELAPPFWFHLHSLKEIWATYCLLLDRACQASLVHMGTLEIRKIQKIKTQLRFKEPFQVWEAEDLWWYVGPLPLLPFHHDSRLDSKSTRHLETFWMKFTCSFYGGVVMVFVWVRDGDVEGECEREREGLQSTEE